MPSEHPIVGMQFRPPAKLIVKALPLGTELLLQREPENPHDPQAIKVLVDTTELPESFYEEVGDELMGFGSSAEALREADEPLHIGYIAQKNNEEAKTELWEALEASYDNYFAKFSRELSGWPKAVIGVKAPTIIDDGDREDPWDE